MLTPAALFGIFQSPPQNHQRKVCSKADTCHNDENTPWNQDDLFGAKLFQDCATRSASPSSSSEALCCKASHDGIRNSEGDCLAQSSTDTSESCHTCSAPADSNCILSLPSESAIPNNLEDTSATLIQSLTRRYLQRGKYRMLQLQTRLLEIEQSRKKTLEHIERRKERKMVKFQRKCRQREDDREQEYQKVSGIIHYLKRDLSRLQRENEKYRQSCQDLTKDNHRLRVSRERTSGQAKQHEIDQLEATNHTLRLTLQLYQEAMHHVRQWQSTNSAPKEHEKSSHRISATPRLGSSRSVTLGTAHNPYASRIAINCVNETEEHSDYRLVQDVYTLTPNRTSHTPS